MTSLRCEYILDPARTQEEVLQGLVDLCGLPMNDSVYNLLCSLPLETSTVFVDTVWLFLAHTVEGNLMRGSPPPMAAKTVALVHKTANVPVLQHGLACLMFGRVKVRDLCLVRCYVTTKCHYIMRENFPPQLEEVVHAAGSASASESVLFESWCVANAAKYYDFTSGMFNWAFVSFCAYLRRAPVAAVAEEAAAAIRDSGAWFGADQVFPYSDFSFVAAIQARL